MCVWLCGSEVVRGVCVGVGVCRVILSKWRSVFDPELGQKDILEITFHCADAGVKIRRALGPMHARKIACGPSKLTYGGPAGLENFDATAIPCWKLLAVFHHHRHHHS